jgi:hypothetical protein
MSERITKARLDARVAIINNMLHLPRVAHTLTDGVYKQNEGHIYIQQVYGGYHIEQYCESGSRNVRERIYTAKECWEALGGIIEGIYLTSKYFDLYKKKEDVNASDLK